MAAALQPGYTKPLMPYSMQVIKRNGRREDVSFDKVLQRIRKASRGLSVNADILAQQVLARIKDGITTAELDELTAQLAAPLSTNHSDWGILASRIAISNHHKTTHDSFTKTVELLSNQVMPKTGEKMSYVHEVIILCVAKHGAEIDAYIKYDRDYLFDYFGFKTLEKSYLLRDSKMTVVERPQHMWMRVALALWSNNLPRAFETYDMLSQKYFTHATPTLFNAGTPRQQLSSCFLLAMKDDSIDGIYDTLRNCAQISKHAGGIGLHIHNVRARGSLIRGTNGTSNGIVPMLQNFNATARYVDQGGGKRNGSFAIYLEPWHADIEDFLKLKLNSGDIEARARDLFYALWISDLFMHRVEEDAEWSLFCPSEAPGLADVWGAAFDKLYTDYEARGLARKCISARKLWFQILDTQIETGVPYLLYKDAANAKSNQQNLGTIKSSNLCTEIIEYSSPTETAVCNLASIALPSFVIKSPSVGNVYDFNGLRLAVRVIVRNLNRVIDINYYPTPETENSNMRHRPIGLGVQGLADVFAMLKMSWESPEATELNQLIFENIYYAAADESANLAEIEGPYLTFPGSPISQGKLQPDLWGVTPITKELDWVALRKKCAAGVRNSLLVAPMPTASTSQILGFNECFEPFTTNMYTRRVLAGEFTVVNKYLMKELIELGIWSDAIKQAIIARNGSVQDIPAIPQDIQARYKTGWELPQKVLIDMAADRGAFICQSQSLNLSMADPTYPKLTSMHFYAWKKGLKTGSYYLRTKAPVSAQKFTVDPLLMAALQHQSTLTTVSNVPDESYKTDSDSDEDDKNTLTTTIESRRQKLERLSRDLEEEGCLHCSA